MDKFVLIVGGAYQGKLAYAELNYDIKESEICNLYDTEGIDFSKKVIYGFERYILTCVKEGKDIRTYLRENPLLLKGKIIICCDISCGVVPMDKEMRFWREETGRCLSYLSSQADSVIRIFCGIGTVLK